MVQAYFILKNFLKDKPTTRWHDRKNLATEDGTRIALAMGKVEDRDVRYIVDVMQQDARDAYDEVTLAKLGSDVGTVAVQSSQPSDTNVKLWIQI